MGRPPRAARVPTTTSLVRAALVMADDFMSSEQIAAAVGLSGSGSVSQTLAWLKRMRVVDCVESDGRLWWFVTGEDARKRTMEERKKEEPGSRGGAARARGPRAPKE